ncbi:MAG: c-type cytochrome domain-containing protein, partial [Planctomycetaceae bacterium]
MSRTRFKSLRTVANVVVAVVWFSLPPSSDAADPNPTAGVAYFEKHIRPLLVSRCYTCHSARAKKAEGGLRLDLRSGWMTGGETGPAIVPGDVEASLLIRAVRYSDPDLQMPPDKALPKNAIAVLERWVQIGAPDPRDGTPRDDDPTHDPSDPIAGRNHWAFQPLAEPQAAPAQQTDWPRTTIDTLV